MTNARYMQFIHAWYFYPCGFSGIFVPLTVSTLPKHCRYVKSSYPTPATELLLATTLKFQAAKTPDVNNIQPKSKISRYLYIIISIAADSSSRFCCGRAGLSSDRCTSSRQEDIGLKMQSKRIHPIHLDDCQKYIQS